MGSFSKKQISISLASILLLTLTLLFAIYFIKNSNDNSLEKQLSQYGKSGEQIITDFDRISQITPVKADNGYQVIDDNKQGLDITFANQPKPEIKEEDKTKIDFPDSLKDPIAINLPQGKSITMIDKNSNGNATLISRNAEVQAKQIDNQTLLEKKDIPANELKNFIQYQSEDKRKSQYYAYQKDKASGESKLKNWTIYAEGSGKESEKYEFTNAKVAIDETGNAKVFFDDGKDAKNQQAIAEVDQSLVARAQKAVMEDAGTDILAKDPNAEPDFVVPYPYYIDKDGQIIDLKWKVLDDQKTIYVDFEVKKEQYPIALDPTLSFTAPGQSNTATVITGGSAESLGSSIVSGDFNSDGKTDLAVGAFTFNATAGRIYIFYNDGTFIANSISADVIIDGEGGNLGYPISAGDFNSDGKIDLVAAAYQYGSMMGRAYIFYNDGAYPSSAANADVIITGEAANHFLGYPVVSGDFNADGKMDLAVGAYQYSSNIGRVYIFYSARLTGSSQILLPLTTISNADVVITGEAISGFGVYIAGGDFNADGRVDIAVGGYNYSTNTGRVYIFYNDGAAYPASAASADVIISGETGAHYFGFPLVAGDFNADGKTDLAVGAYQYSTVKGRVYIFYSARLTGGSQILLPLTTISNADVVITGEAINTGFGVSMKAEDLNADGKTDLIVTAYMHATSTGRVYVFYNDGSYPALAVNSDVIITGETTNSYFGFPVATGDFNFDGKIDMVMGAYSYNTNVGRVYILYSQNGLINRNQSITGEGVNDQFGFFMTTGDFNADGRVDLAVGSPLNSANTGRVYIFYNDGSISTTAAAADVIITGEASSQFGNSLISGDFNADGKTDLAVSAPIYSVNVSITTVGRVYIFYNDGSIPTTAAAADVIITGDASGDSIGSFMVAGDFNTDGKIDLAVSARNYATNAGRVYIFNGGSMAAAKAAATANVIIAGEASGYYFGWSMTSGDFNADGRIDLAVGANLYNASVGRVYIFYNDGTIPTTAATADVIITGEAVSYLGVSMAAGDVNADGKTDLVVGAMQYSTNAGRVYIFYGGSLASTMGAASANIKISGEAASSFGTSVNVNDFNADGKIDIAVSTHYYASNLGRVYIFYNDGSIPVTAATADITINGESSTFNYFGYSLTSADLNADGKIDLAVGAVGDGTNNGRVFLYETRDSYAWQLQKTKTPNRILGNMGQELKITSTIGDSFGSAMISGDFNGDGKTDLAVGAYGYSTNTGRIYIFYNNGNLTTRAGSADVIITGETGSSFGTSMTAGDFNADGKTDLAVGAYAYTASTGRAYIFNGGSMPAALAATSANVIITGEAASDNFSFSIMAGDFNADGKTDLAVGAYGFSGFAGRAYIFNGGAMPATIAATSANVIINGAIGLFFAYSMSSGDFNADGKTDLAVGAFYYSGYTGRAYIFNGGAMPATIAATSANVIITGEGGSKFGVFLIAGDLNADGKTDLVVCANSYSSSAGRVYIFNGGSMPATIAATSANVIIDGEASTNLFGMSMISGDFNSDGKTDLAIGAYPYSSNVGRVYVFNGGSMTAVMAATSANSIVTGESSGGNFGGSLTAGDINNDGRIDLIVGAWGNASTIASKVYIYTNNEKAVIGEAVANSYLGYAMTTGDFNADGRTDLAVSAYGYNASAGRVYVFYNDGAITNSAATADVIITETSASTLGYMMISGDFNADGKADLALGAPNYSGSAGRVYIFNGGSMTATMVTTSANVTIDGEGAGEYFGIAFAVGDFNADGKTDLATGAFGNSNSGRAYIFNGGTMTAAMAATSANVKITGEVSGDQFGSSFASGDLNADGKIDLVVGAQSFGSLIGRAYIFNGGSLVATMAATSANVIITGQATDKYLGNPLATGDFNSDGKTDLATSSIGYATNAGRVYVFYGGSMSTMTSVSANRTLEAENANDLFGTSLAAGDLNTDGKTDLVVGATGFSTSAGRVYIFYNNNGLKNGIPGTITDVVIDSPVAGALFGHSFAVGEFSGDGNYDLVVGSPNVSSNAGTFYIYPLDAGPAFDAPYRTRGNVKMKGAVKLQ